MRSVRVVGIRAACDGVCGGHVRYGTSEMLQQLRRRAHLPPTVRVLGGESVGYSATVLDRRHKGAATRLALTAGGEKGG